MRKHATLFYIGALILIHVIFFLAIRSTLLFTPDFGLSDAYHGNIADKFFLAQRLKQGDPPFWIDSLQGGYPFFSEWQVGGLYLPNLIILRLFSFSDGFNFLLVTNFFLLSLGFFLLLKEFKTSPLLALLVSLSFAFNGTVSLRLIHFSLIQTVSLSPLIFYLSLKWIKTRRKMFAFLLPITLSQMIFAGFPQVVFMMILGLLVFVFFYLKLEMKSKSREMLFSYGIFILILTVGIFWALPHILPALQITRSSARNIQLDYSYITAFPLQWKNLANFVSPYLFGNPKYGTYPPFDANWGIFWENTPYAGIVFAIMAGLSFFIFLFRSKSKQKSFVLINLAAALFFLLLALGKNSPLYFIFNFPPFNFFRTQSRFLLMVNFFLFFVAAFSLDYVYKKSGRLFKILILLLLVVNFIELLVFARRYHLFIPASTFLQTPQLARKIDNDYFYLTLGQPDLWNKVFLKKGWVKKESIESYVFFKNFLFPNSNLLYDKKTFDIYAGGGSILRRADYLKSLIINEVMIDENNEMILSERAESLLRFLGIKYLISPWRTRQANLKKIDKVNYRGDHIFLYAINDFRKKPPFYTPSTITRVTYLTEFEDLVNKNNDFEINSIAETNELVKKYGENNVNLKTSYVEAKEDTIEIKGVADREGFVVLRKNFYPEWELYIDGRKSKLHKTNLIHLGFIMPQGEHTIKLSYKNSLLKKGLLTSSFVLVLYALILTQWSYIISIIDQKRRRSS